MTNEKQTTSKGPSREQAGIMIVAGIVLALGGCRMCFNAHQVQEWIGFTAFLAGVVLFLLGWFSFRKR